MIDLKEILVANGVSMLLMWFLLSCRRQNRETLHAEDKMFDAMCLVNLLGALFETIAFLVDGKGFAGGVALNFVANTLCFLGTVSIGLLWCFYVDLRIYRNYNRTRRYARIVTIPWLVEVTALAYNCFGTEFVFSISAENVYARGQGAIIGYISLMIYFAYSVYLVIHSRKQGINLHFFPIQYFVGPCLAGVLIQFFFYGITTSWLSVSIAMVFVQMQTYAENLYKDELSGLFNRRYFDRMLEKRHLPSNGSLHGIMLDINDFKSINDSFGHSIGDRAICAIGDMLFKSIPDGAIAIRYAGDEFIVLMPDTDEKVARTTMDAIAENLARFNKSKVEPFSLHAAMGYAKFESEDDAEAFLRHMDEKMYEEKREFHLAQ